MKKKIVLLAVIALIAVGVAAGAVAYTFGEIKAELRPDFTVEIDGVVREFKNANGETVEPILYNGTTYLPVRAIGEIMGKKVYWYEDEKRIELKDGDTVSTVTDADVIIPGTENSNPSSKTEPTPDTKQQVIDAELIGKEKAQEIALAKAGLAATDVIFDRTELDRDDGILRYEVEFRQGRTEYDADIKADDGTILKWDVDYD